MIVDVLGSYRFEAKTGLATGIAAATATAGHVFSARHVQAEATRAVRLRALELACVVLTAFDAAQEVGLDLFVARSYSVAHTGGGAVVPSKTNKNYAASVFAPRIGSTGALTAGTQTLDTDAILEDSFWATAVGASLPWRRYDFTGADGGGLFLFGNEGLVARNTILMGASGVVRWSIAGVYDEVIVG